MMRFLYKPLLRTGLVAIALSACSTPSAPALQLPKATEMLPSSPVWTDTPALQDASTPAPYTGATPAIVIESLQDMAPPTPLPPVVAMPTEALAILNPGPGSQVNSPFRVNGWGGPSFDDRVRIRLIGEGGRVLSEGWSYLYVAPGNAGQFIDTIPFDISHVAEEARLEISMQSRRDRQLSHLATVNLTLLTIGQPLIHPAIRGTEKLTIFYPRFEYIVSGGTALVQGAGWVDADTPLIVSVRDNHDNVLGIAEVVLDAPAIGQLGTFTVEVPYEVPFSQWARIAVGEMSTSAIPGWIHFTSVEVWLRP